MSVLVGVDQGTTGTRAIAFDERFEPVAEAYRRVPVSHRRRGWDEKDAAAVVASVAEVLAEIQERVGRRRIAAVGLDNEGETVVAWDAESGEPLAPAIVWSSRQSEEVARRLAGQDERVRELAGTPVDPYFSSTKIRWLLEHDGAVRDAAAAGRARFGTLDAYLSLRLGGEPRTEPSTAARTQLQELARPGSWSAELCEVFGVDAAALPPIGPSAGDLGTIAKLPLRALLVDQTASLAGHGCVAAGHAKATYGTGIFVLAYAGGEPPADAGGLLPTVAWQVGARAGYALDGGVFAAASALEWLAGDLGLLRDPAASEALAASVPDSGGVRFLPALSGLGAPWWRPAARGVWAGMTHGAGRAQLVRAVLEALCLRVRDIVEALREAGSPPSELRVDGGMTANRFLVQRQADTLGIPVRVARTRETTALGAAAFAAVGAGLLALGDLEALGEGGELVEPSPGSGAWREDEYAAWRTFVERAAALAEGG